MNEFQVVRLYFDDGSETLGTRIQITPEDSWKRWEKWLRRHNISWVDNGLDEEDRKSKEYKFRYEQYLQILALGLDGANEYLQVTKDEDVLKPLPSVLQDMLAYASKHTFRTEYDIQTLLPPDFYQHLKPYQREGVQFVINHQGRALLADEMGLGKTLQAIALMLAHEKLSSSSSRTKHLIVCPATLRDNWSDELKKWIPDIQTNQIAVILSRKELEHFFAPSVDAQPKSRKRKQHEDPPTKESVRFWILSYNLTVSSEAFDTIMNQLVPQCLTVTFDESTRVKSSSAARTQRATWLAHKIPNVLFITGTPGTASQELYSMLHALQPKIFSSFWIPPKGGNVPKGGKDRRLMRLHSHKCAFSFAMRWCDPFLERTHAKHFQWNHKGTFRAVELYELISYWCMIRRMKDEVLTSDADKLPPKTRHKVMMNIPDNELAKIQAVANEMEANRAVNQQRHRALQAQLAHDLPRVKKAGVQQYVREHILPALQEDPEAKCLLFAHHHVMIDALIETLTEANWIEDKEFFVIRGGVSQQTRQPLIRKFQTDPACRIAILGITAASEGLQCSKANLVVFTEMNWTPSLLFQAEARAHRMGCTRPVKVIYLMAKLSLDETMWQTVTHKEAKGGELSEGVARKFKTDQVVDLDDENDGGQTTKKQKIKK